MTMVDAQGKEARCWVAWDVSMMISMHVQACCLSLCRQCSLVLKPREQDASRGGFERGLYGPRESWLQWVAPLEVLQVHLWKWLMDKRKNAGPDVEASRGCDGDEDGGLPAV